MASNHGQTDESQEQQGLTSRKGPVEVDWPKTVGYYGGIALAVASGMVELPLAIFIGAVPFFNLLDRPKAPRPARLISQLLDGASKPVGGDSSNTLWLTTPDVPVLRDQGSRRSRQEPPEGSDRGHGASGEDAGAVEAKETNGHRSGKPGERSGRSRSARSKSGPGSERP